MQLNAKATIIAVKMSRQFSSKIEVTVMDYRSRNETYTVGVDRGVDEDSPASPLYVLSLHNLSYYGIDCLRLSLIINYLMLLRDSLYIKVCSESEIPIILIMAAFLFIVRVQVCIF